MNEKRTVCEFSDKPVALELIENLIMTASKARSGANEQAWEFHFFLNGKAKETLLEINNSSVSICSIYLLFALLEELNESYYNHCYSGLICRPFGYASNRDKYGEPSLATCKIIKKEDQTENYNLVQLAISDGKIPLFY